MNTDTEYEVVIQVNYKQGEFRCSETHSFPLKEIAGWHPFTAEEIIQGLLKKLENRKPKQQ